MARTTREDNDDRDDDDDDDGDEDHDDEDDDDEHVDLTCVDNKGTKMKPKVISAHENHIKKTKPRSSKTTRNR